ncbi:sugar ABC transporter ATP-binding protein [Compostibacter hankyongensis]
MRGISKSFSGVTALDAVDFALERGEVHALMGENGAGKSTLMKVLAGICKKDAGQIFLNGMLADIETPKTALDLGISMIHQELSPVREMTVAENIFLGKEPCHRFMGIVNTGKQRQITRELLGALNLSLDPDLKMRALSIAETQMVEIVKAVSYNARIIIMDEPTSAITGTEAAKLFEIIYNLRSKGIGIIYISHKMDEIFRVCDTVTVLRDGRYIETRPADQLDHDTLVKLMVGRQISDMFPKKNVRTGDVSLAVEGLTKKGLFRDISFKARKGEILGFAGLLGAGRSEIMEAVFGLRRAEAGGIRINGKPVRMQSPRDAIRHHVALITEDRQQKGLNLKGSVKDNITLVNLKKLSRLNQFIRFKTERSITDTEIGKLRIKTRDHRQLVHTLSGGNQQKVVVAKWLLTDPEIIIFDEPTRGIDIGAKAEIYKMICELAEQGKTVLMVSSELEEILGLCDRVIVLYQGRISGEFERSAFDQERIMKAAMGNEPLLIHN